MNNIIVNVFYLANAWDKFSFGGEEIKASKKYCGQVIGLLQRQKQDYQWHSNEHGPGINKSHSCFEFDSQR